MFSFIKKWFTPAKCALCGQKPNQPTKYFDDKGKPVVVCRRCTEYAERRAYRKR